MREETWQVCITLLVQLWNGNYSGTQCAVKRQNDGKKLPWLSKHVWSCLWGRTGTPKGVREFWRPICCGGDEDERIVGHVPKKTSAVCAVFLRWGGLILCRVTGSRCYSEDLPQDGLETSCVINRSQFESSTSMDTVESLFTFVNQSLFSEISFDVATKRLHCSIPLAQQHTSSTFNCFSAADVNV